MQRSSSSAAFISRRATDTLWSEQQTVEKLEKLCGLRFGDVPVLRLMENDGVNDVVLRVVSGRAKRAYAEHFQRIRRLEGCEESTAHVITKGAPPSGYIPFYQYISASLGSEIIYVCYSRQRAAVVLLLTDGSCIDDLGTQSAIVAMGEPMPYGKLCAWCGRRRTTVDEPRLLKCPCKKCRYCGPECQLAHWVDHRRACLPKEVRRLL